jgi:hypothetical protein
MDVGTAVERSSIEADGTPAHRHSAGAEWIRSFGLRPHTGYFPNPYGTQPMVGFAVISYYTVHEFS